MPTTILYVEDDADFRRAARAHIGAPKYHLDVALCYESGIAKAGRKLYDFIVVDGLEGKCFDLIDALKDVPHGKIIVFSRHPGILGKAEDMGIPVCYKTGGLDGLVKKLKRRGEKR